MVNNLAFYSVEPVLQGGMGNLKAYEKSLIILIEKNEL